MEGLITKGSSFAGFPPRRPLHLAAARPDKHSKQGPRRAMIRVRSIAAQYAREFARSASVARGVGESRGPHVVVRALTDSSHLIPAAAPLEPTKQLQRAHVAAPDSAKLEPQRARAMAEDELKHNRTGHARKGKRPKQWDVSCCDFVMFYAFRQADDDGFDVGYCFCYVLLLLLHVYVLDTSQYCCCHAGLLYLGRRSRGSSALHSQSQGIPRGRKVGAKPINNTCIPQPATGYSCCTYVPGVSIHST